MFFINFVNGYAHINMPCWVVDVVIINRKALKIEFSKKKWNARRKLAFKSPQCQAGLLVKAIPYSGAINSSDSALRSFLCRTTSCCSTPARFHFPVHILLEHPAPESDNGQNGPYDRENTGKDNVLVEVCTISLSAYRSISLSIRQALAVVITGAVVDPTGNRPESAVLRPIHRAYDALIVKCNALTTNRDTGFGIRFPRPP